MIKNDEKQKEIINMIISANINVNNEEHHNILYKLITLEQNEVAFTEKLFHENKRKTRIKKYTKYF